MDFSFSKPPAARLVELGFSFVVGYISIPPASTSKNISKVQCEAYIAAGLKVLLVWEMSATSPNLGAAAGAPHGRNAAQLAGARGYPVDVSIIVADDTNTTDPNIDAHEAYVRAFADNCGPYPIGLYGDTDILYRCRGLWRIGWVPNAWSWSGTSRKDAEAKARAVGAHVLQRTGYHIDNLWAVDPNDAIADFPAWGTVTIPEEPDTTPPPPRPPIVEEDDMALQEVLVPKFAAAQPWFPYLACFDNGTVRPLGPSKVGPTLGQSDVTDEGQYRRLCAWAGIQLEVEMPKCAEDPGVEVTVEGQPFEFPVLKISNSGTIGPA